tara:strand:+ start:547 stop:936 length:390 start_codon:yes stop_codon:yes gene_type:complete
VLRAATFLAILALVSLVTTPFGYMPDRNGDGDLVLRICGGTMVMKADAPDHAAMKALHGADDDDHGDHGDGGEHETRCNYAVSGVAPPPHAPTLVAAVPAPAIVTPAIAKPLTGIFPAKLPPSTGPPAA